MRSSGPLFPNDNISDWSKLKEFADDNFKFDENGKWKKVLPSGEKEKLFRTSNFSLYHSVFRRLVLQTRKNKALFGKGLIYRKQIA